MSHMTYYMYHILWLVWLEGVKPYLGRVRERAEARIEAYLKEHEEEEKAKRIEASPGGLGQVQTKIIHENIIWFISYNLYYYLYHRIIFL